MAEQQMQGLTLQQVTTLFQQMMQTLVTEIRKPPVDPIKEAQKEREKRTKDANLKAMWERKAEKKRACAHSRQDGTCVIAWATQSDNVMRGYCPNCDSSFAPEDGESYLEQRRRPRGLQESVRVVA